MLVFYPLHEKQSPQEQQQPITQTQQTTKESVDKHVTKLTRCIYMYIYNKITRKFSKFIK